MPVSLIPMPQFQAGPQGYNFQPISAGIETIRNQQNQNAMLAQREAQLAQQKDQFGQTQSLQRDRMAQDASQFDKRMAQSGSQFRQSYGLQKSQLKISQEAAERQKEAALSQKFAGLSQYVLQAPPEQRAELWGKIVSSHPNISERLKKYGFDPADVTNGANLFISEARGYEDPMSARLKQAQIKQMEAKADVGPTYGKQGSIFEKDGQAYAVQFADRGPPKVAPLTGLTPAGVSPTYAGAKTTAIENAKAKSEAGVRLPAVVGEAKRIDQYIDGVLKHPAYGASTGILSGYRPSISGSARDFDQRLEQLRGKAFVAAFERLKGAGAITEAEGKSASLALARLKRADIGSENFRQALDEFRQEVRIMVDVASRKAGGVSAGPAATQNIANDPLGIR